MTIWEFKWAHLPKSSYILLEWYTCHHINPMTCSSTDEWCCILEHSLVVWLPIKVYDTIIIPLVVPSPYMYILLEWLTYQHVAVDPGLCNYWGMLVPGIQCSKIVCVVISLYSSHLLGALLQSWPHLPVDTTLSWTDDTTPHMSTALPVIQYSLPMKSSTLVVAEGIPPVTCCLIEKVIKWEYINLSSRSTEGSQLFWSTHCCQWAGSISIQSETSEQQ